MFAYSRERPRPSPLAHSPLAVSEAATPRCI
jgi:hypothetical protein